jgi:hypothetical protein
MEQFLSFVKVSFAFTFNMVVDSCHGIYVFFNSHSAEISSYAHYAWFNLKLFGHYVVNLIQTKLA